MSEAIVHHFSEDPSIRKFVPHVPATNQGHRAAVWAIDAEHAPLYWFPRACPRVTVWPRPTDDRSTFDAVWTTTTPRVHVTESDWLQRMRSTTVYRYDLPATAFTPWLDASGQWIAETTVTPLEVLAIPDLLSEHATAGIELRFAPSLWAAHDRAISDDWDFSIVRMGNAHPRP
ncbi:MAG: DUF6886 family protein [Ilumatobacteraceae bacterium]